jgi:hypothetical protein
MSSCVNARPAQPRLCPLESLIIKGRMLGFSSFIPAYGPATGSKPATATRALLETTPASGSAPAAAIGAPLGTAPASGSRRAGITPAPLGQASASAIRSVRITRLTSHRSGQLSVTAAPGRGARLALLPCRGHMKEYTQGGKTTRSMTDSMANALQGAFSNPSLAHGRGVSAKTCYLHGLPN